MARRGLDEETRRRCNQNLRPARRGEIKNPEGKNQWTYRADFERSIARLMDQHGDAIATRLVRGAARGKDLRLLLALLERVFPRVERHELKGDVSVDASGDLAAVMARLARLRGGGGDAGEGDAE